MRNHNGVLLQKTNIRTSTNGQTRTVLKPMLMVERRAQRRALCAAARYDEHRCLYRYVVHSAERFSN